VGTSSIFDKQKNEAATTSSASGIFAPAAKSSGAEGSLFPSHQKEDPTAGNDDPWGAASEAALPIFADHANAGGDFSVSSAGAGLFGFGLCARSGGRPPIAEENPASSAEDDTSDEAIMSDIDMEGQGGARGPGRSPIGGRGRSIFVEPTRPVIQRNEGDIWPLSNTEQSPGKLYIYRRRGDQFEFGSFGDGFSQPPDEWDVQGLKFLNIQLDGQPNALATIGRDPDRNNKIFGGGRGGASSSAAGPAGSGTPFGLKAAAKKHLLVPDADKYWQSRALFMCPAELQSSVANQAQWRRFYRLAGVDIDQLKANVLQKARDQREYEEVEAWHREQYDSWKHKRAEAERLLNTEKPLQWTAPGPKSGEALAETSQGKTGGKKSGSFGGNQAGGKAKAPSSSSSLYPQKGKAKGGAPGRGKPSQPAFDNYAGAEEGKGEKPPGRTRFVSPEKVTALENKGVNLRHKATGGSASVSDAHQNRDWTDVQWAEWEERKVNAALKREVKKISRADQDDWNYYDGGSHGQGGKYNSSSSSGGKKGSNFGGGGKQEKGFNNSEGGGEKKGQNDKSKGGGKKGGGGSDFSGKGDKSSSTNKNGGSNNKGFSSSKNRGGGKDQEAPHSHYGPG
ncbi:unnamed protein product, partial [Amoebophrya sp. A25]